MVIVKFKRTPGNEDIAFPKYQTDGAAAFDLHAAVNEEIFLKSGERKLIPTGLKFELPSGYYGKVVPRSGLALKNGISLVNTPGTLDCDYRGEVGIILINHGEEDFVVKRHDRIAQMLILKYEQAAFLESELSETNRGSGGFGSTGK